MSLLSVLLLGPRHERPGRGPARRHDRVFYVGIYTLWLKRSTPQNIVIGGAAGALPPMIGYAAVTGSLSSSSLVLFAIIFIWTPPHFWALALLRSEDYAARRHPDDAERQGS